MASVVNLQSELQINAHMIFLVHIQKQKSKYFQVVVYTFMLLRIFKTHVF